MFDPRNYNITVQLKRINNEPLYVATVDEFFGVSVFESTFDSCYELILKAIEVLKQVSDRDGLPFPLPR